MGGGRERDTCAGWVRATIRGRRRRLAVQARGLRRNGARRAGPDRPGWLAMIKGNRYDEIKDLIEYFSRNPYKAREGNAKVEEIQARCLELFARDYALSVLDNTGGLLCGHYPPRIALPEYQITSGQVGHDGSRMARCRSRFICPVILYNGKHICRSSTLAGWGEIYGRSGYNYLFSGGACEAWFCEGDVTCLITTSWKYNVYLLYLFINYICDLMVENKKVKFGMNVTSSEKVDKEGRYADFCLVSLPYPGCEFFKTYRDRDYTAEGLVFNWNQEHVDAPLYIPPVLQETLGINWHNYMSWDLMEQTQNYLKLLLHIITLDEDCGLLVHCISGWDRTPLFVSLLRLSLWADGAIHCSLGPVEILYLTIAYDWFLFGHMLDDRLSKGEEVSPLFCFEVPQFLFLFLFFIFCCFRCTSPTTEAVILENKIVNRSKNYLSVVLQRNDWTNSCERSSSCDSEGWQIVSGSGSLHGQARLGPAGRDSPLPHDASPPSRQLCLEEVRTAFLAAYSQTVGLSPTPLPPPVSIGGILETFVRGLRA
uniref:Myotubularin related protein 14 n=1 Tax=Eptatretus burgeri TaxID=7764 RepID=A0A8C4QAQ9_EPTBU